MLDLEGFSMASSRSFQVLTTFCDGVNWTKVEKYRSEQNVQKKLLLAKQIPWVFVFVNGEEDKGNV
jgi:hypothetical protein